VVERGGNEFLFLDLLLYRRQIGLPKGWWNRNGLKTSLLGGCMGGTDPIQAFIPYIVLDPQPK